MVLRPNFIYPVLGQGDLKNVPWAQNVRQSTEGLLNIWSDTPEITNAISICFE